MQFDNPRGYALDLDVSVWRESRLLKPPAHEADLWFGAAFPKVAALLDFQPADVHLRSGIGRMGVLIGFGIYLKARLAKELVGRHWDASSGNGGGKKNIPKQRTDDWQQEYRHSPTGRRISNSVLPLHGSAYGDWASVVSVVFCLEPKARNLGFMEKPKKLSISHSFDKNPASKSKKQKAD